MIVSIDSGGVGRDPIEGVDVRHYPDLVAQGGLVNALRVAAEKDHVAPGLIDALGERAQAGNVSARIDTGRGRISVRLIMDERRFLVDIHDANVWIAGGETADISSVLAVAAAWRDGASPGALELRFPFMQATDLGRVLASPDPICAQWHYLRTAPVFYDDRPLVDVAFDNPVLRSFFPDLSHRALELSRSFHDRRDAVRITPLPGRGYSVSRSGHGDRRKLLESLDEATATAAELLSGRCPDAP